MAFTFAGAQVGATYNYSINDTDSATSAVTGSGTITSATQQKTSINVSSLTDGTLTLTVYLTDPAGNQGSDTTDTINKNRTSAPTGGGNFSASSSANSNTASQQQTQTQTQTQTQNQETTSPIASTVRENGTLIRYSNNPNVYVVEDGIKKLVPSAEVFSQLKYDWAKIVVVLDTEVYTAGENKTAPVSETNIPVSPSVQAFTTNLQRGMKGDDVKRLQDTLKTLGFFPENITANGVFGPTTQNSVKSYQKSVGLPATGFVGPLTRAKLNQS
jgi:murein L,D-transpeptidase YcbB/YkuD